MKLTFIGTRGEINVRTRRHRVHTLLLVSYRAANVMIGYEQRIFEFISAMANERGVDTWLAYDGMKLTL